MFYESDDVIDELDTINNYVKIIESTMCLFFLTCVIIYTCK